MFSDYLLIAIPVLRSGVSIIFPSLFALLAALLIPLISVAVLSGPMMKAGLLGWIRFLPPGAENLQTWGGVLIWLRCGWISAWFHTGLNAMPWQCHPGLFEDLIWVRVKTLPQIL